MDTEPHGGALRARLAREAGGAAAWTPGLYRAGSVEERPALAELLAREADLEVRSTILSQLEELEECRDPRVRADGEERRRRVLARLDGRAPDEYGCWVHFPWRRQLVQVLPPTEYREVRASRNRYKITAEEQERLRTRTVGVVGLSVGHAAAMTMALEGCAGAYRLADFDRLALSNLNRLTCGVGDLGLNKAVLSARHLFEVDPYLDVQVFPEGLSEDSIDAFLAGGRTIDVLVEECDDLYMKVLLREQARRRRIPVVMETNDRGMLDVERFDLEPDREVLHGLVGPVRAGALKGLPTKDKVPFVLRILGDMSPRLAASLVEIDQTISSWPQLGSGAMLGGAVAADAVRRMLLGELRTSGRFHVDVHQLVRDAEGPGTARPAAAGPAVSGPVAVETAAAPAPRPEPGAGAIPAELVRSLVAAAAAAPSGGNCQPWRFVWSAPARLQCFHDRARSASFLDFEHRAAYLALGAAVENVVLCAGALGLSARVLAFPGPDEDHVCDVLLAPGPPAAPDRLWLAPFVPVRATNRRVSRRRPLAAGDVSTLESVVDDPAVRLQVLTGEGALDEIGAILGAGDRFRFFDERLYREMMSEMRWSPREAEETRDGVDVATLELGEVDEAGVRLLSSWAAVRFLRTIGAGGALEDLSRKAVAAASAVALATCEGTSPRDYFRGGRAVQRVWLAATALGLAVQPMSALPYVFARLEGGAGFEPPQRATLLALRERYARLFDVGPRRGELLLFRLARAGAPRTRSLRRPPEAVLTFA